MFVLRSVFWLTVAFLVIAPHGTDWRAGATAVTEQAIDAGVSVGTKLIVSQITDTTRLPTYLLVSPPSANLPTATNTRPDVVFPLPRPASLS